LHRRWYEKMGNIKNLQRSDKTVLLEQTKIKLSMNHAIHRTEANEMNTKNGKRGTRPIEIPILPLQLGCNK